MSEFKLKDFDVLKHVVTRVSLKTTIRAHFYPEFEFMDRIEYVHNEKVAINSDLCMRLAILLFDPNTPLNEIPDLSDRAYEACRWAGIQYSKAKDQFPEWVTLALNGQLECFNKSAAYYISKNHGTDWLHLVILTRREIDLMSTMLINPTSDTIKEHQKVKSELEQIKKKVVNYNVSTKLMVDIDSRITYEALDLSPEGMARMRRSGQQIFPEYNVYTQEA